MASESGSSEHLIESFFLDNEQIYDRPPTGSFGILETFAVACTSSPFVHVYTVGGFEGGAMIPTLRIRSLGVLSADAHEVSPGRSAGGCVTSLDWYNDQLVLGCVHADPSTLCKQASVLLLSTCLDHSNATLKHFTTGAILPPSDQMDYSPDRGCITALGGAYFMAFGTSVYQFSLLSETPTD